MSRRGKAAEDEDGGSASAPRRRGRPSKGDQVLDAAVRAFLRAGYSSTTLESIAAEAQVSTATVFKHYRAKADIFGAIMSRVFGADDPQRWTADDDEDLVDGLVRIGTHYADTLCKPDIRALFRVIIAEVPRFPELGVRLYEEGKAPYLQRVHDFLKQQIRRGNVQRGCDVELATRQFLGMINDVVFWPHLLVMDLPESAADTRKVVRGAARAICKAYGTSPRR